MRLAGTANAYSTRAMPQPMRIAATIGKCGNFKCPYQASVMKMFETRSSARVIMAAPVVPPRAHQQQLFGIRLHGRLRLHPGDQLVQVECLLRGGHGGGWVKRVFS